jgi:hypothetical protein
VDKKSVNETSVAETSVDKKTDNETSVGESSVGKSRSRVLRRRDFLGFYDTVSEVGKSESASDVGQRRRTSLAMTAAAFRWETGKRKRREKREAASVTINTHC